MLTFWLLQKKRDDELFHVLRLSQYNLLVFRLINKFSNRGIIEEDTSPKSARKALLNQFWTEALEIRSLNQQLYIDSRHLSRPLSSALDRSTRRKRVEQVVSEIYRWLKQLWRWKQKTSSSFKVIDDFNLNFVTCSILHVWSHPKLPNNSGIATRYLCNENDERLSQT